MIYFCLNILIKQFNKIVFLETPQNLLNNIVIIFFCKWDCLAINLSQQKW